jgi:hypothetical protein
VVARDADHHVVEPSSATPRQEVIRPPLAQRWALGAAALGFGAEFIRLGSSGDLRWFGFALLSIPMFADAIRGRVEVDLANGTMSSVRGFHRTDVPLDDVAALLVPLWGPIQIILCHGSPCTTWPWGGIWPGQLSTPIYAGADGRRVQDLALIVERPIRSPWPSVRPGYVPRRSRQVRPWWVATFGTIALTISVVLIVATR